MLIYFIYYLLYYFFPFILFQEQLVEKEEAFLTLDFVYYFFFLDCFCEFLYMYLPFCQLFYIHGLAIMYNQIIEIKMIYNFLIAGSLLIIIHHAYFIWGFVIYVHNLLFLIGLIITSGFNYWNEKENNCIYLGPYICNVYYIQFYSYTSLMWWN